MKRQPLAITLLSLLSLLGVAVLLFVTRWGIGLSLDSLVYVSVARQLRQGERVDLTFYPPLFPELLAATGLLGFDPLDGARWFHAFLFGANIVLVGLVLYRHTARSLGTAVVGSLLLLSPTVTVSRRGRRAAV